MTTCSESQKMYPPFDQKSNSWKLAYWKLCKRRKKLPQEKYYATLLKNEQVSRQITKLYPKN